VTIQFGHNDQKADKGISVAQFTSNLETMVSDVTAAGGTPILVTSLSRRKFDSAGKVKPDLAAQVAATLAAAKTSGSAFIDLNRYSMTYLNAIGQTDALLYDLAESDATHINVAGDFVFGNMVGWLVQSSALGADVKQYISTNETIIAAIEAGTFIYPVDTTAS
jgi:lysophospholipase L1-like esterase